MVPEENKKTALATNLNVFSGLIDIVKFNVVPNF